MVIISFSSIKGGVGKTTSCCNLAYYFAKQGRRCLVVDFDSQGGSTHHLSHKFNKSFKAAVADVLLNKCKVATACHEYSHNLYLLPTNMQFADISSTDFSAALKNVVASLDGFDLVLFDLSPAIYPGSTIPLGVSDFVVVPVDCGGGLSVLGLKAEQKLIKTASTVKLLGVLPTMCDRTSMTKCVLDFLQHEYPQAVLPSVRRNTHLAQAGSLGQTIFEYKNSSNGARDYSAVGAEILRRLGQ